MRPVPDLCEAVGQRRRSEADVPSLHCHCQSHLLTVTTPLCQGATSRRITSVKGRCYTPLPLCIWTCSWISATMGDPVVVAYTTAYPEAAGTLAPSISLSITDAIHSHFSSTSPPIPHLTLLSLPRTSDVFSALSSTPPQAQVAVAPIENSETGSFRSVYHHIVSHQCYIIGEFAVSSPLPPPSPPLWTRFVLVSLTPASLPPALSFGAGRVQLKSSCVLGLSHEAGSVFRILSCFALRNLNVLKFEMRAATPSSFLSSTSSPYVTSPGEGGHGGGEEVKGEGELMKRVDSSPFLTSHAVSGWSYLFYVDWLPSGDEKVNGALLASLREFSVRLVELGVYQQNLHIKDKDELLLAC